MASELVIEGVKPWDGRYELDLERELTTREWGWVKRLSGYLPLTLGDDAYGDPEFVCVLAAIAIRRAGRVDNTEVPAVYDKLIDAPFGATITIDDHNTEAAEDGDAGPPVRSSNGSTSTSGDLSTPSSASSDSRPSATGTPALGSSPSAPPMSVT